MQKEIKQRNKNCQRIVKTWLPSPPLSWTNPFNAATIITLFGHWVIKTPSPRGVER